MESIKIKFTDAADLLADVIIGLLKPEYNVEISDDPDFLFYSVFGNEHLMYKNCVKIFYTAEPVTPNFEECDYAIGFDYISFEDRYYRLPLFAMNINENIQDRSHFSDGTLLSSRKFCNFIYSNSISGSGARLRGEFCRKLMEYRHVDCPGMVLNNMDSPLISSRYSADWGKSKLEFISHYKFTIAFENTLSNGYTTEKLVHPLMAGSIPIYYGNPRVAEEFNPAAFINCNDYDNDFNAVIERVKEIDNDDELAYKMINTPPMMGGYDFDWKRGLGTYLNDIIAKGKFSYISGKSYTDTSGQGVEGLSNLTMNDSLYARAIIDEIKSVETVVIYGDGKYGSNLAMLFKKMGIQVTCFLVSKKTPGKEKHMGIPIVEFDKNVINNDSLVMVAVREEAQQSLTSKLSDSGFDRLVAVNDYIIKIMNDFIKRADCETLFNV